jgi:hypothetical protein
MPTTDQTDQDVAAEALELVADVREDFANRDALYRDIDAVVFGELPVEIPEAYRKTAQEVHSPLAIHICNSVSAALSINPFAAHFRPTGFGDAANQNASKREHFFEASWARQEDEAKRRLFRLFMWNLTVKGEAVFKTLERTKKAWSTYSTDSQKLQRAMKSDPEYDGFDQHAKNHLYDAKTEQMKLELPYPIATTDVPPETFYYRKSEDGFTLCAEVKQVPYLEALDRYHVGLNRNGQVTRDTDPAAMGLSRSDWSRVMGQQRTLSMVEKWDCEEVQYILCGPEASNAGDLSSGTLVRRIKHGYGNKLLGTLRGPYFHALGITTASRLPEYAGLSILFGFLRLFPLLDSLLTVQGNAAVMTGFPAFKRTLAPGQVIPMGAYGNDGTERESAEDEIEAGTIYPYDIGPVEMPRAGVESDKLIANVRQFLELALPSIVQGVVAGDQSGYALNQAAHLARLSWDPIVSNAEMATGERIGFESWLIERRIGETVYAWGEQTKGKKRSGSWLGIGPADLNGVHRYEVALNPETPSNEVIETRAIVEKMDKRLITWEDAVEQAGANPDEVDRSWMLYDLKRDPEIQARVKQGVFQALGTMQQKAIAGPPGAPDVGVEAAQAGQMAGLAGAPGANPVPSPGNGMPITPPAPQLTPGMSPIAGGGPGPGGIAGNPVLPNPPQNAMPLPGQP